MIYGLLLGALAGLLVAFAQIKPEPSFRGQRLSGWLTPPFNSAGTYSGTEPVRAIGTNALPFLIQWLHCEPGLWRLRFAAALKRVPGHFRFLDRLAYPGHDPRCEMAFRGFAILGEQAASAAPNLAHLLATTRSEHVRKNVLWALGAIGEEGAPALIQALKETNTDKLLLLNVLGSGHYVGPKLTSALPLVLRYAADSDPNSEEAAIKAIVRLRTDPRASVSALTNCIATSHWEGTRVDALRALDAFATERTTAVSCLTNVLYGSDSFLREEAYYSLLHVAPETVRSYDLKQFTWP